jgi:hypothetical protein
LRTQTIQQLEEQNNRFLIEAYDLQDELSPEVPEDQITEIVSDSSFWQEL